MSSENLAPRDAKMISIVLRSYGIEECEPKVIAQFQEFAYKYCCDVIEYAYLCCKLDDRTTISAKDMKLALQTNIGKHFVPPPPRNFIQSSAELLNSKPLSTPDPENLLRAPNVKSGLFGIEYIPEEKDSMSKKRKVR